MKADTVFTPSDCCDTLARPQFTDRMKSTGSILDTLQRTARTLQRTGLTSLYNHIFDEENRDEEICQLRAIHIEIDEAVREAYALDEEREPEIREFEAQVASEPLPGWREIELGHGFHETRQGVRFTISPQARVDVLDKLLALNHYRYRQEVERGLHSGKGRGASKKRAARETAPPAFEDGGLFRPEGSLF